MNTPDESTKDDDDGDNYTPAKDYKGQNMRSQPKRKRGRPRKIRDPNEPTRKKCRNGRVFKCPHCVKSFTRRYRVAIHIRLRHGFECTICNLK